MKLTTTIAAVFGIGFIKKGGGTAAVLVLYVG